MANSRYPPRAETFLASHFPSFVNCVLQKLNHNIKSYTGFSEQYCCYFKSSVTHRSTLSRRKKFTVSSSSHDQRVLGKIACMDVFDPLHSGRSPIWPNDITPHERREVEKQLKGKNYKGISRLPRKQLFHLHRRSDDRANNVRQHMQN